MRYAPSDRATRFTSGGRGHFVSRLQLHPRSDASKPDRLLDKETLTLDTRVGEVVMSYAVQEGSVRLGDGGGGQSEQLNWHTLSG